MSTQRICHLPSLFPISPPFIFISFFFFNDTPPTEIYTLSLHDALPIFLGLRHGSSPFLKFGNEPGVQERSEEHTSELQSRQYLVCRLLLEKKKKKKKTKNNEK